MFCGLADSGVCWHNHLYFCCWRDNVRLHSDLPSPLILHVARLSKIRRTHFGYWSRYDHRCSDIGIFLRSTVPIWKKKALIANILQRLDVPYLSAVQYIERFILNSNFWKLSSRMDLRLTISGSWFQISPYSTIEPDRSSVRGMSF